MIREQRKALEKAAIWQARKDGLPYKKARSLARRVTQACKQK